MSKAFFFAFFFYGVNSFKPNYLKISSTSFLKVSQQSETQLFESSWQTKQIKAEGIFHSHFESPCGNIRGLASNRLVQPNEFVVSVPVSECMIIPEESSRMDSGPVNFKGTTYLALYLLDEWKLQSKSKFYGYIAQLPNHLSSPIHWSDEMLTTLPYEKILCNVLQQKNKLKSVYDHLRSRAISIEYDYDRFLWAMEMVGSRSFKGIGGIKHFNAPKIGGILSAIILSGAAIASQLPNQETLMTLLGVASMLALVPATLQSSATSCVLLPAIDSANHHSTEFNCELEYVPASSSFVLRAKDLIKSNNQVLISYGNRNNDELLQYFGFVQQNNPDDIYCITFPATALQQLVKEQSGQVAQVLDSALLDAELDSIISSLATAQAVETIQKASFESPSSPSSSSSSSSQCLIVNKRDMSTWTVGSLSVLGTRVQDGLLKTAVCLLLRAELAKIQRWIDTIPSHSTKNILGGVGPREQDDLRLAALFIEEKRAVLNTALAALDS